MKGYPICQEGVGDIETENLGKFGIRIWGWPTLFFYLVSLLLFLGFQLTSKDRTEYFLEPGSGREALFESIFGVFIICYLWTLMYRTKKLEIRISRFARWGVIALTLLFAVGEVCNFLRYLYNF